jgi:hypothetical protein
MPNTEYHLSAQEELELVEAIKSAELNTSGEIRVHIDPSSDKDGLERAKEVFFELKMNETEAQNGVLFYLTDQTQPHSELLFHSFLIQRRLLLLSPTHLYQNLDRYEL